MAKKKKPTKKTLLARTPIVAVMGHVDHGKTSLLDAIRDTSVQEGEAGGITQNTRAHSVTYKDQDITFVDTPGHKAFSEMRSRGAKVTDIVLLVVAADDGVQPQTKESIKFALEQKVPMLVAINKMDLPGKKMEKLRQELSSNGVLLEAHGGDVMSVEVSAVKKTGLDELMDSILLLAEVSELKAAKMSQGVGTGFVLESNLDKHLGPVTLVIVKTGDIQAGQYVVYQDGYAKVRGLLDESQAKLKNATQGKPAWIIGLKSVLDAGEIIQVVETEKEAKALFKKMEAGEEKLVDEVVEEKAPKTPETRTKEEIEKENMELLSEIFSAADIQKDIKFLNLIIKTDTNGTLEAILSELDKLNDEEVQVNIISSGTGEVTEKDVTAAKDSRGLVIAFQVKVPGKVDKIAKKDKVLVRTYDIIYNLLDEVSDVMDSLGAPIEEEVEVARAKVKKVFQLSNGQYVAGSEVKKGSVIRGYRAYVLRGEERVKSGKIVSLRHGKKEVKEMKKGQECGILLEPNIEVEDGDEIVCYKVEKF